jgi:hypothetical protein
LASFVIRINALEGRRSGVLTDFTVRQRTRACPEADRKEGFPPQRLQV